MKKMIWFLVMATFLSLGFASCDNKDDTSDEDYEDLTLVVCDPALV